ncbi:kinase-like domain-containing protein [Scleroderma citrinum]
MGALIDNIEVALKTAAGDLARRGIREVIKDAVREVYTWSKLRHKNVHPLLGITTEFDHTISFVSAWMEKGNAIDYVQDKEVDPRPLIEGIARGLHYLHDYKPASIFHGDLKGSNVLVSQDGRALLTDFGFTRVVNSSLKMTVDKICGGALNWMAPEIISGGEVSAEGDVWAFGMTVLELFTRNIPRYPPSRPSEDETLSRLTDRCGTEPGSYDICCQASRFGTLGEGSVLRADFNPPLELPLQDQFSLSIVSQPEPGLTRRADLSLDARDVLTKSDQHTFRRTLEHLEIILEISPIASPDLLIPTTDELLQQCPQFRILLIGKP